MGVVMILTSHRVTVQSNNRSGCSESIHKLHSLRTSSVSTLTVWYHLGRELLLNHTNTLTYFLAKTLAYGTQIAVVCF